MRNLIIFRDVNNIFPADNLLFCLAFLLLAMLPQDGLTQTYKAMKFSETNLRTGNTTTHPIVAVYSQRGTPFEIISTLYPDHAYKQVGENTHLLKNFKPTWYRVRDFEGQTGWVKSNQLSDRSMVMVISEQEVILYEDGPNDEPKAKLPLHLVMRSLECTPEWCRVLFGDKTYGRIEGWVKKAFLWGNVTPLDPSLKG